MKKLTLALISGIIPLFAFATDISQLPVESLGTVKPNLILGYDDSGSMDRNYLPDSPSPALTTQSSKSHWYNLIYYNPTVTYKPWIKSVKTAATDEVRYPDAALLPAVFTSDGSSAKTSGSLTAGGTYQVTYTCGSTTYSGTYDYDTGAKFTSRTTCQNKSGSVYVVSTAYAVKTGQSWQKGSMGSQAVYYDVVPSATCTVNGTTCFTAPTCTATSTCAVTPTGAKLQKVVIPLTDTVGQQNFANWKQYASIRKYLVSYAMSGVLPNLKGMNVGFEPFNSRSTTNNNTKLVEPTQATRTYTTSAYARTGKMYNLDVPSDVNTLLDLIYNTESSSATPTHANMVSIGSSYQNANLALTLTNDDGSNPTGRKGIIQYACQKNAAFVLTDGYANESTLPAHINYSKTTWGASAPYSITYAKSLADIALAYYTLNLRPDLATGKVPKDTYTTGGGADLNTNLHMNTYALTLGINGLQYNPDADPYTNPPTWANPTLATNDIKQIDDLWHATINGRGQMFTATNTDNLITYIQNAFMDIILRAGSQSAIAVANVNMTTVNNAAYVASFNASGWFGDVYKYSVNLTTGNVDTANPIWSAREKLDAKPYTAREIFTKDNAAFGTSTLPTLPSGSSGSATVPKLVSYLKGDRTDEGTIFRERTHVLGDAVNAEPVIYNDVVYQATNDGMLHAFDAADGNELWAYVPSQNIPNLGKLSLATYSHQYFVDGTPSVGTYDTNKTLIVGGLGAGSFGFYALDVTDPSNPDAQWEFPATSTQLKNGGNTSISRPRVIATHDSSYPNVVIIGSGYNNGSTTGGDGKGHVWILNPETGAVVKELITSDGSTSDPIGLSTFAAFVADATISNKVDYLYGGDEKGNIWKINAKGNVSDWTITKFAYVGKPITTKPELTKSACGNPIVLVGSGRLLGTTDLTNTDVQSFYAIQDFQSTSAAVITPSNLMNLSVSGGAGSDRLVSLPSGSSGSCSNWCAKDTSGKYTNYGWMFNFPEGGERVVGNPIIGIGHVAFTTNVMSANSCSSASYSWFLSLNTERTDSCSAPVDTGSNLGHYLGGITGSRPVLISLPSGHIKMITHLGNGDIITVDTGAFSLVKSAVRSWRSLKRPMR